MSALDIVNAASDPSFYGRVSFIALKVAQQVAAEDPGAANHDARLAYANRVLQGNDNAILLAQHVATNSTISGKLESDGPTGPPDGDIEFVLATIWDARSIAFYTPPPTPV
jgi:hypothetical protein